MRRKIILISFIAIIIIISSTIVFAATGTVTLKSSTTEVKKGDTFTVTISASSENGINGVDTKYTYDTSKLELVSSGVKDSNWNKLGGDAQTLTIICDTTETIKNADLFVMTFKVKDSANVGDKLKVETTQILLDTDTQTNSEVTVPAKKVEVTVVGNSGGGTPGSGNNTSGSGNRNYTTYSGGKTNSSTASSSSLPKAGEDRFIILAVIIIASITVISYIKCRDYKYVK